MALMLDRIWPVIEQINRAVDPSQVEDALLRFARPFGFSTLFSGFVPTPETPKNAIGERILLQRFPSEWTDRYNQRGYVFHDPIVHRLQFDRAPFSWADAYASCKNTEDVALIRGEASEFGVCVGHVIPVSLLDGGVIAVSFGARKYDLAPSDQSMLDFVANFAIGTLLQRRDGQCAKGELTGREQDCLTWAAEGKTDWEIAKILGISKPTVAKHILSMREKLGATTKAHAIALALREKIIR